MKKLLLLPILFSLTSCGYVIVDKSELEPKIYSKCEEAYFEGQKDALNGDIRIKLNSDSCYVWTKSPWDSGLKPTFNPSIICNSK